MLYCNLRVGIVFMINVVMINLSNVHIVEEKSLSKKHNSEEEKDVKGEYVIARNSLPQVFVWIFLKKEIECSVHAACKLRICDTYSHC